MVLDAKQTYRSLKKKGFVDSTTKSKDHRRVEYYYNDKLICITKISHGSKGEINDYLIKQMYTQCRIDKDNFIDLIKCPLSEEGYIKILKANGEIEQDLV